jgi:CRP/FNR family transcriptional regulator
MNLPSPHNSWDHVSSFALSAHDEGTFTGSSYPKPPASLVPSHVYPPDVAVFQQGSPAEYVYFIERGMVKLNLIEQDGQQAIVGLRSSGWILGTSSVILQKANPVTATTLTHCHIRFISADAFRHLLKTDVQFSWHIQQSLSREMHEQITRIGQLNCLPARQRLEQLLWDFASALTLDNRKKEVKMEIPLKQLEMAQLIGISPEHLCRMLKQLDEEGIIIRKKGWVILNDAEKLWHSGDH